MCYNNDNLATEYLQVVRVIPASFWQGSTGLSGRLPYAHSHDLISKSMDPDQSELFQSIILDHDSRPTSFFEMDDATHTETGHNPVCGDRFVIFLDIDDGVIRRASFDGRGCTISKASASMMVGMLPGKSVQDAAAIRDVVRDSLMSNGLPDDDGSGEALGDLVALTGVRDHPSRIACVMLGWDAMVRAISGKR